MLSSLVTKTMHKNVLALMKERVLKPMGITDIEWLESPEGNTVGGWGLYLKTPDIAKIAILLANMGKWNGKTLIPEEYLKEATRKQIDTPDTAHPVPELCRHRMEMPSSLNSSFHIPADFQILPVCLCNFQEQNLHNVPLRC